LNGSEVVEARATGYLYIPILEYVKPGRQRHCGRNFGAAGR
jgi:hypothetical protein